MAKILILGGGFGGVVAAETLAGQLDDQHEITVVSRDRHFIFYPALVRLAFGKCDRDEVSFDLRKTMLRRRVNFISAEVARLDLENQRAIIAHGEVEGNLTYDYLIYSLGRRLATEQVSGFYENAHHVLNVDGALKFGKAADQFHHGHAVIGQCPGARLPVPVYETAFALSRLLEERGERKQTKITIVSPEPPGQHFGDLNIASALRDSFEEHGIDFLPDFPIERLSAGTAYNGANQSINFNLLMLLPPFRGSSAASYLGITNDEGYINVDATMRVVGAERMYAVGDCVNLNGPKMGHMAVRQADVAAANLAAEIEGKSPEATYNHEMRFVIDEGGSQAIYAHKNLWGNESSEVKQGRFWNWAKEVQQKYWQATHS